MKKGQLVKFPNVSTSLDENQMLAMNFDQVIDSMIRTFGPNFTKDIFRVAMNSKTTPKKPKQLKKVGGK